MIYITNAFSINMLKASTSPVDVRFLPVSTETVIAELAEADYISAIGHADLAAVVSAEIGREVPANRINVTLSPGDVLLVAQYRGPRLPEGATELPEGATIEWWHVELCE